MNLLIVDDDATNRKLLRAQLEAEGYGVVDATNGVEALKVLEQKHVDGVVSDILMPDMDGFQLCLEIRKREKLAALPFIFYTSTYSSPQDQQLAKTVGADDYLSKPSPTPVILAALREATQKTRQKITVAAAQHDETYVLKQYNAALVRKLEQRNLELEESFRQLQSANREVRESEGRLRLFVEHAPAAIAMLDGEMRYLAASRRWLTDYHLSGQNIIGRSHYDVFQNLPERWKEIHRRCLSGAVEKHEEDPFPRTDGHLDWVKWEIHPWRKGDGAIGGILLFSELVTERKAAQERIRRLNRVHAMLSSINALIIRVRNRQGLLHEACRIAVEYGGFGIAWIGEYDAGKAEVTPLAWAGIDAESLATTRSVADRASDRARGVLENAFRERRPAVNNDITKNPQEGGPRRQEAIRRGYLSVIALPLIVDGEIFGNFSLHAKEPNYFDDEEIRLLTELAGDISFALEHIAVRGQAEHLAFYDALTGLPNRSLFLEHLSHALHSAGESSSRLVLALGDIKRFRLVNDTLGRHAGDEMLKQVADRLRQLVRNPENLARVSANCYATFLPDVKDLAEVAHRVENLTGEATRNPVTVAGQDIHVAFAVGVSVYPQDGTDAETLYRNAEAALVKAKAAGATYQFYEPALNARVAETLNLENKLRRALEQKHFVLFYQPKVDTRDRRITGLEALIRWNDPEIGLVPPAKFIPLMEESGLILDVGRWALGQAVDDWRSWASKGIKPPRVAVNVSSIQLRQRSFVDTVVQAIEKLDGADASLDLEITESMIMDNVHETVKKLQIIRGLGVEIYIDDFGTGYSSLSYIARLPVNSVKIDRSFITGMAGNPQDMSIVTTIIALAHSLNMKVVAEGVETEAQAKLLTLLKCDEAQGYLFSKPLPASEIEALLGAGLK